MKSELHFVLFLLAPWVVVVAALIFYRRRQAARDAAERSTGNPPHGNEPRG